MTPAERAVAVVQRLDHDLAADTAQWMDALDILSPVIQSETLEPIVASSSCFEIESEAVAVRRAKATKKSEAGKRGVGRTTSAEVRALAAIGR